MVFVKSHNDTALLNLHVQVTAPVTCSHSESIASDFVVCLILSFSLLSACVFIFPCLPGSSFEFRFSP